MPSTWSQGEPLTPYDPEMNRTLRRMNNQGVSVNPIRGELGERVGLQPPRVGDENNQVPAENRLGDAFRVQDPPGPRQPDNFRVNLNIADSDGSLVLPPLPQGHTFVVTSNLMKMPTTRGLFTGFPADDPHAHIAKLNHVCKSSIGRPDWDMNSLGCECFPHHFPEMLLCGSMNSFTTQSIHGSS